MAFNAGAIFGELGLDTGSFERNLDRVQDQLQTRTVAIGTTIGNLASDAIKGVGRVVQGIGRSAIDFLSDASRAARDFENTMKGLRTVSEATGEGFQAAENAAQELARDGLITVGDAAEGLKTLLAAGFGIPEATQLINAMKDSAAFNGAAHLSMGEAIVTASQGIKNQNSELIDNVGITKNASAILKDYGFALEDMTAGAEGAAARQAFLNGFLKEATIFQGDAAKAAESLTGKQNKLSAVIDRIYQAVGRALNPVLERMLDLLLPLADATAQWFESMEVPIAEALTDAVNRLFEALGIDKAALLDLLAKGFEAMKRGIEGLPEFIDGVVRGAQKLAQIAETSGDVFELLFNALKVGAGEVLIIGTEVTRGVGKAVGANTEAIDRFSDNLVVTVRESTADAARSFTDLFEIQESEFGREVERRAKAAQMRAEERAELNEKKRILEAINREGDVAGAILQGGNVNVTVNQWPPVTTGTEQYIRQSEIERRRDDTGQRGGGGPVDGETP